MNFNYQDFGIVLEKKETLNIYFLKNHNKPKIVLIHGANADSMYFIPLMVFLHQKGFEVRSIDLPGHGLSDFEDLSEIHVWDYVNRLKPIIEEINPLCIIGHSMGGFITAALAREIQTTPKIILVCAAPHKNIPIAFKQYALLFMLKILYKIPYFKRKQALIEKKLMSKFSSSYTSKDYYANLKKYQKKYKSSLQESPHIVKDIHHSDYSNFEKGAIKSSTLIIASKKDDLIPYTSQKYLQKFFNANMITLKNSGHIPMLGGEYYLLEEAIYNFLLS